MTSNITAAAAHSGSHCWEQDGSFHSVCIFVISVSLVCSLVTVVTAWRVAAMVASALREPNDIHETLKMYSLQSGSRASLSRPATVQDNLNNIETLETVTCTATQGGNRLA